MNSSNVLTLFVGSYPRAWCKVGDMGQRGVRRLTLHSIHLIRQEQNIAPKCNIHSGFLCYCQYFLGDGIGKCEQSNWNMFRFGRSHPSTPSKWYLLCKSTPPQKKSEFQKKKNPNRLLKKTFRNIIGEEFFVGKKIIFSPKQIKAKKKKNY